MSWLDKIKEYAPDIAGAILSGGATLPATAIRIASKELLGYETDNPDILEKAVNDATPEQMLALKQAENNFKVRKLELRNEELEIQTKDTQQTRNAHKHHWMPAALCSVLTVGLISFVAALFFFTVPEVNQRIMDTLFGAYLTAWLSSVNYWVSTSRSSAEKSAAIK